MDTAKFEQIFDSLNNGLRTDWQNPALNWMKIADEQGWGRDEANAYYMYATDRIYK